MDLTGFSQNDGGAPTEANQQRNTEAEGPAAAGLAYNLELIEDALVRALALRYLVEVLHPRALAQYEAFGEVDPEIAARVACFEAACFRYHPINASRIQLSTEELDDTMPALAVGPLSNQSFSSQLLMKWAQELLLASLSTKELDAAMSALAEQLLVSITAQAPVHDTLSTAALDMGGASAVASRKPRYEFSILRSSRSSSGADVEPPSPLLQAIREYLKDRQSPYSFVSSGQSTSPPAGHAAPTAGDAAPTAGHAAPTAGDAAPTAGHAAPTAGDAAPTAGHAAPTAGHAAPTAAPGLGDLFIPSYWPVVPPEATPSIVWYFGTRFVDADGDEWWICGYCGHQIACRSLSQALPHLEKTHGYGLSEL
ncbi:hypothetical protein FN846DRAFT_909515 [Sphaerosporella brunnea]|uniref:Uncharacterized protein n=1 Tax=Sphaerosporella brunnea TaxID=1250544 RepID=A0A5J5EQP8_9PEZI|nr:hypothetical protein FN846DRAFT_909515 [Sphaerosporella brunnea]